MASKELTPDQARFLNAVLDYRIAHKKWPSFHQVERQLRRELDAVRVASSLSERFGQQLSRSNRDEELVLPFDAIRECERAEELYSIMPPLVAVMWEIYQTTEEKPAIRSDDLKERQWSERDVTDAYYMLRYEAPFSGSATYTNELDWRVDIHNTIRDYKAIRTAREYIDTRTQLEAERRVPMGGRSTRGARGLYPRARLSGLLGGIAGSRALRASVFIVHGHDEALKNDVARTLEKLGHEARILHEQADQGRTIIEKLESHADVDYAVVLLTPDDDHFDNTSKEPVKRARQNVILELGFFLALLGRDRVFILRKDDPNLELPSDYDGVIYTLADAGGAWRYRLAKELREAGLDADSNALD